jgi:Spy/CpxP family protein refolding chaperone
MDIFTQNRFFIRIIVVLILLNLITIGYMWWDKMDRPTPGDRQQRKGNENSTQILREKLGLSRSQEEAIYKLREDFNRQENEITSIIRSQRDSMNAGMFRSESDTTFLKNIAQRVADNEYRMELLRILQAQKLKEICTKEQLKDFQHLVNGIRDFLQPQKKDDFQPQKKENLQPPKKKE